MCGEETLADAVVVGWEVEEEVTEKENVDAVDVKAAELELLVHQWWKWSTEMTPPALKYQYLSWLNSKSDEEWEPTALVSSLSRSARVDDYYHDRGASYEAIHLRTSTIPQM